jgi:hypothetical protein
MPTRSVEAGIIVYGEAVPLTNSFDIQITVQVLKNVLFTFKPTVNPVESAMVEL